MPPSSIPTASTNGPLWGERAEAWAAIQEGLCRPVYQAVLTRCLPTSGMAYLDAGCGSGMAAALAASLGAAVSGLDAATALLAIARTRVPNGTFVEGDLESLPFADHTFDLVTGFNSFQYAGNPAAALREGRRVARPGATVVVMTWGDPASMPAANIVAALKDLLPPAPPGAPGPFALSDRDALIAFAAGAGLRAPEILDIECPWYFPDLPTALLGLGSTGIAARARHHSGADAVDAAHTEALEPFLQTDGTVRISATFRCLFSIA